MRILAPGKLMIAGEYSVLGPSGTALAVAVDAGVEVAALPAARWALERSDTGERWEAGETAPPESLRFAHAALESALESAAGAAERLQPHLLRTTTRGGTGVGTSKPGVGGSASVSVAVVAAVLEAWRPGLWTAEQALRIALAAHGAAQGGRGSGYDIATIALGGLVAWRPSQLAGGGVVAGEGRTLEWPVGLSLVAGYTGQSASTRALLTRLEAHAERDRVAVARGLAELGRPVDALIDAFGATAVDVSAIQAGVRRCHGAFVAWDRELGLGAMTGAVTEMVALAEGVGAAAKVSGAGGGDSVIALADGPEQEARIRDVWRGAGYAPLDVEFSHRGVHRAVAKKSDKKDASPLD